MAAGNGSARKRVAVLFGGAMTLATVTYIWRRSRDLLAQRLL